MVCGSRFPPREGLGFYVLNLARRLRSRGVKVRILTRGGPRPVSVVDFEGLEVWRLPFLPCYPLHLELHSWFLKRAVRQLEPVTDLFHVHSPLVPRFTTSKPLMATVHSVLRHDVAHTPVQDLSSLLVHLQSPFSFRHEGGLLGQGRVLAVSEAVAGYLQHYYQKPSSVIYNGVDTARFRPPEMEQREPKTLLVVCRLVPGKGLEALPELARRLPEVNFIVAGDGPLRNRLQAQTATLGVKWLGHVDSRERLVDLYQRATAMLLPSHYEGFPTVALEALASGCTVLASAVGGLEELIRPPRFGWLFPPGDLDEMVRTLREALGSPEGRRRRSREALEWVRERFSWDRIADRQLEFYEELVSC